MRVFVVFVLLACLYAGATAYAHALHRIDATVRCAFPAEDTLAHVRLTEYDPQTGVLRYACKSQGY